MSPGSAATRLIPFLCLALCLGCTEAPQRRGYSDPPPPTAFLQSGETVVITDAAMRHIWTLSDWYQPLRKEEAKGANLRVPQLKIKDLGEPVIDKFEIRKAFQGGGDTIRNGDQLELAGGHGSSFLSDRLTGAAANRGLFRISKALPPQAESRNEIRYGDAFVIQGKQGYLAQPENIPLAGAYMEFVPDRSGATSFIAFRDIRAALNAAGTLGTVARVSGSKDWIASADLVETHRPCSTEIVSQEKPGSVRFHWLFEDTLRVTMEEKVQAATIVAYWVPKTWTAEQSAQAGCSRRSLQSGRR